MLGRTDSRSRLLLLLIGFVVGSLALVGRLAYWQVAQRDMLTAQAVAQTTIKVAEPTHRGDIYDRSGTVVLATTIDRDRLVAAPSDMNPEQRHQTGDELVRLLGLDDVAGMALRDKLAGGKSYVILARGHHPDARRTRSATGSPPSGCSASRSSRNRCASIRRRAADPTRPWRRSCWASSTATGRASTGSSRPTSRRWPVTRRSSSPTATRTDGRCSIRPRSSTTGRRARTSGRPSTAGLQLAVEQELLAAWIADKAKSVSAVVMDPYTGRDLRRGHLSVLRRQPVPRGRDGRA